jgi:hypothetical protein
VATALVDSWNFDGRHRIRQSLTVSYRDRPRFRKALLEDSSVLRGVSCAAWIRLFLSRIKHAFLRSSIEVQKVDCIDVWMIKVVLRQGKKANLTEFSSLRTVGISVGNAD